MGTDKNLEIGDFSIYHLAGFLGVLLKSVSTLAATLLSALLYSHTDLFLLKSPRSDAVRCRFDGAVATNHHHHH